MTIREACAGDAADLYELYFYHLTALPGELPAPEDFAELLGRLIARPDYHILIAEEDGRAVSSVTLVVIPNLTHNLRPYALIENVVTHADYRGRGLACALMERAKIIAREAGCYKIMLMTGSKKDSTLRFYEKCGFDRHSKTGFQYRME